MDFVIFGLLLMVFLLFCVAVCGFAYLLVRPTAFKFRRISLRALFICTAILCVLCAAAGWWYKQWQFDAQTWRNSKRYSPTRVRMVEDLLSRHRLVGMTVQELENFLGPPDNDPLHLQTNSDDDYFYLLGPERGLISTDNEWLQIKIEDGRVVDAGTFGM